MRKTGVWLALLCAAVIAVMAAKESINRSFESGLSDGVMFATSAWSVVYAIDAKKGTVLWRYDPAVLAKMPA